MCNFTPHRFANWVCPHLTNTLKIETNPLNNLTVSPTSHSQTNQQNQTNTSPAIESLCAIPTTGALLMCITATRTGEICPASALERKSEQKRPGICGACEFARVAAEERALAEAKIVGYDSGVEAGKEGGAGKVDVERSLSLRGRWRGTGPVRQSTRLRAARGRGESQKLARR